MTIQEMRELLESLVGCKEWSLQLIKFEKRGRNDFCCNAHPVTIATPNALDDFLKDLADFYAGEGGKLDQYRSIEEYDGNAEGTRIYRIGLESNLTADAYRKWIEAFERPDMLGDPLAFGANGYVLTGGVREKNGEYSGIRLVTLRSPMKSFRHTFCRTKDAFCTAPEKMLSLYLRMDVLIYRGYAYLFHMDGEKFFDMERAYLRMCTHAIDEILEQKLVSDEEAFRDYASSGFNPRRFVAFQAPRLQKLRDDAAFRERVEKKFLLLCAEDGTYDSTDKDNVERLVKFLCGKGMLDPMDDGPVEVDGSRKWR